MGRCLDVINRKREKIYKRDNYTCIFCGKQFDREQLTIDHILPLARGGNNRDYNLVTSCRDCNVRKGDKIFYRTVEKQLQGLEYEILNRKKKLIFNLISYYTEHGILRFNNII